MISTRYFKRPQVTSDREAPEWFLDELRELDPYLRVEWYNAVDPLSKEGPSFRLIRVLPDQRWAHVLWFLKPSYNIINYLRQCDSFSRRSFSEEAFNDMKRYENLIAQEDKELRERAYNTAYERGEDAIREGERGSRIYDYPGVR